MNPKDLAIKANIIRKEMKYDEALVYYKECWDLLNDPFIGTAYFIV